jgi:hypothetical protein
LLGKTLQFQGVFYGYRNFRFCVNYSINTITFFENTKIKNGAIPDELNNMPLKPPPGKAIFESGENWQR